MIIESVMNNEAIRNSKMIEEYNKLINELPKGSLVLKKNKYYYLKYRKDGKVYDEYIGKDPNKIAEIQDKIERRKHYEKMLSSLKQEQKVINQILEGLK